MQCPLLAEGGSIHIEKYNVSVPPGVVGILTLSVDLLKVTQLSNQVYSHSLKTQALNHTAPPPRTPYIYGFT